jgi:hypothetical protein
MPTWIERLVLGNLCRERLDARSNRSLDPFAAKLQFFNQLLCLTGVGFVLQAIVCPPDNSVEARRFLVVIFPRAQATSSLKLI